MRMAPKLNIHERVFEFLRSHPEERFTSRPIADWIFKQYPDECAEKRKKSSQEFRSDEEFLGQLTAEIAVYHRLIKKYPQVRLTEGRPRKLYFSEKSEADEAEAVEIPIPSTAPVWIGQRVRTTFIQSSASSCMESFRSERSA